MPSGGLKMTKPCVECGTTNHQGGILCEPCFEAQVASPGGHTIAQLRAAFEDVADDDNWKGPIRSTCDPEDMEIVGEAIQFFTGSVAKFHEEYVPGKLLVEAAGYYAAVGA